MQVHAVGLRTLRAFEKVAAVFCGAEAGFEYSTVDLDVIDGLDGPKSFVRSTICDISAGTRRLRSTHIQLISNATVYICKRLNSNSSKYLSSGVGGRGVDDYFKYFAEFAKVFILFEDLDVGEPLRQADHEHKVLLHDAHVRQVSPILAKLLLLVHLFLAALFFYSNYSNLFENQLETSYLEISKRTRKELLVF